MASLTPIQEILKTIQQRMKDIYVTQGVLGRRIGRSKQSISSALGGRHNPRSDYLLEIIHELGGDLKIEWNRRLDGSEARSVDEAVAIVKRNWELARQARENDAQWDNKK